MIKEINIEHDYIQVILNDGTVLKFSAHYSGYEDCVHLILLKNNEGVALNKEVFIGYTDEADKFNDKIEKGE